MTLSGYPVIIHPGQQRFIFAQEDTTLGTPSTNAAKTFLEPCNTITTAIQRNPYSATEYVGIPTTIFDMIETTHHSTITVSCPWRSNGMGAWALAAIMGSSLGGAQDANASTVSGFTNVSGWNSAATTPGVPANAVQHYIVANNLNNICNTFTIWHDAGDGQYTNGQRGVLRMSRCTVESIRLTFTPGTAVMAEITLQGDFPIFHAANTTGVPQNVPTTYTSLADNVNTQSSKVWKNTRMMGFQGQSQYFNIYSSTAGVKYTNQILSGDMTITRPIEIIEVPYSQTPAYYLPGAISVTGTFTMLFDGLGPLGNTGSGSNLTGQGETSTVAAYGSNPNFDWENSPSNSIYQDYLNFKRTGTASSPNEVRYTNADGHGFDITFYPIKWTSFGLNATEQSLQVSAGFTSFNDLAAAAPAPSSQGAAGTIVSATIDTPGAYSVAPTGATFSGGGGTGATITAVQTTGVSPNITVTGVTIGNAGTGYSSSPSITFTGGTGTAATGHGNLPGAASKVSAVEHVYIVNQVAASQMIA